MEQDTQKRNTNLSQVNALLMILVYFLVVYHIVTWLGGGDPIVFSCGGAPSYEVAKRALSYNPGLDGSDHDGRPCESKFPLEAKADLNPKSHE